MKKNFSHLTKVLAFAMAMSILPGISSAQNSEGQFMDFRAFGGINLSSLTNDGTQITLVDSIIHRNGVDAQVGYQGGLSITYGNHFYISPGLWYTKFTVNSYLFAPNNQNNDTPDFESESSISMLSIPVRFGFRFIDPNAEKIFNIRLFGGITGQHVLSVSNSGDPEIKLTKEDYENIVMNATAGFGVDVLFLFADIGYDLGLTNFEKTNSKSRHNSLFVNVGAKFGF